ncbi:Eco57I restriction-modification methylase domain-containing protein [Micromonospora sp. KC721]|uniref:Eco57I restriction-modification methylase domain-containing protein n=1 Tax=Micromonospora sp. KC721 TaxID=2530380 RepID=UPI00104333D6|nr:N-6 DNA methylase [Micromonospora sp. KC721]TDB80278.1 SAM-dependent DNA methyltransferase [Micromonospora sp. KC721]
MTAVTYPAVRVEGGLLPAGLVQRIGDGAAELPGSDAASYGLQSGESVRRYANRSYAYLQDVWRDFARHRARSGDSARLTRERWLLILLRELGYDGVEALPGGITVDEKAFPVSHRWDAVPVHLLGWGTDLDRRTAGMRGAAAAAPHSLMQQLLNRADQHLWGIVANGQRLRLLRDLTSLVGTAYLEFDLEAIFEGDLFPDFVLLYRVAHASRLTARDAAAGPSSCLLEAWRTEGAKQGERALAQLRDGVEAALEILGTGFLDHPDNAGLRERIDATLSLEDYKRSLLRLVYRLLFWFVAEDRDALLDPAAAPESRRRYDTYFSARRLRELALRRRHSGHGDLWESVRLVFDILGKESGHPGVGLPGIGGLYEPGPLDEPVAEASLSNTALLRAVEALAVLPARKGAGRQRVDFQHLGAEELGSVYESLLELRPRWDAAARRFHAERLAGNERKTTGSYYTPSSLVERLLDSALDPLLDEATALPTPEERVKALLDLTVCDPACGSGHFLIAAARRIAKRVAAEETDDLEPAPGAVRSAMRRVVARCIYGVDKNEMAAELAKVSLWLEAMEPGRPLGYLDANIRVGNSLLGVTPKLLKDGIPDAAFTALTGDDKKVANALKKQNGKESAGQGDLFGAAGIQVGNASLAAEVRQIVYAEPRSLADVHVQAKRARAVEQDRRHAKLVADAWCAAFVQPKTEATRDTAITQGMLERLDKGEHSLKMHRVETLVEELTRQYRFFHWHIEFPHIFRVPDYGPVDEATGWQGGFSCVLGNPPWERVKLQEQEFFAARDPEIANAKNAAARKKAIATLAESEEPAKQMLYAKWTTALHEADAEGLLLRSSGRYPLTGRGDVNTYAVFAETAMKCLSPKGATGLVLPTGIATDYGNRHFFAELVTQSRLIHVYDFRNNQGVFRGVGHGDVHFCLLAFTGGAVTAQSAKFAFGLGVPKDLSKPGIVYQLRQSDILLVNPNTQTCPSFTMPRAAEIVAQVHRAIPVLWREVGAASNPWSLSLTTMFHMSSDSGMFYESERLSGDGWVLDGNVFKRGEDRMLPLYEGKMFYQFDHRYGDYRDRDSARVDYVLPRTTDEQRGRMEFSVLPRYWVDEKLVDERFGAKWQRKWLLCWRDIARNTDERTVVASVLPESAVGHTGPIILSKEIRRVAGLIANLSSFCLDFIARQKVSGTHLTYNYLKQFPVLSPELYDSAVPWDQNRGTLNRWVGERVLELTYTTFDLAPFARDLGYDGPPFRWDPARRELLRAELDAAYFHLYGIDRDDVDYIMDTFKVVRQKDEAAHGEYRTKRLILDRYDAMATAIRAGRP